MLFFNQKSNYSIFFTLPILLFFGNIFYDCLAGNYFAYGIGGINIAIHEGGHIFFGLFRNQFLGVAGGTLMQLLIPLSIGGSFIRQKDYFGVSIIFAWIGINLFDISRYLGDAIDGRLPLLMLFGKGHTYIHDWSYMLNAMGLIHQTGEISYGVWIAAISCFVIFFLFSFLLIINRWRGGEV